MKNLKPEYFLFFAIATVVFILTSCETKSGSVLARVGNTKLTKAELIAQLPEELKVNEQNLPVLLDMWVNSELFYQEAVRRGLTKDERLKIRAEQLAKDVFMNALIEQEFAKIKVPSNELLDYFNNHKEDFMSEVKIRRIVLRSEELAERTLAEIKGGGNFVQLAKERSIEETPDKGEPSRFFARGITEPNLEEAIFALKPGEISDVLTTSEGYQIIQLVEKRKVKKDISFAEVADYIESALTLKMRVTLRDSILNDLRSKGNFQTFPNAYFSSSK